MQLNRVHVFHFDPGRMPSNLVDSLRSKAPTPTTVRMQLNHVHVFHFDPGRMSSNRRLTEKRSAYPYDSQNATELYSCTAF